MATVVEPIDLELGQFVRVVPLELEPLGGRVVGPEISCPLELSPELGGRTWSLIASSEA